MYFSEGCTYGYQDVYRLHAQYDVEYTWENRQDQDAVGGNIARMVRQLRYHATGVPTVASGRRRSQAVASA